MAAVAVVATLVVTMFACGYGWFFLLAFISRIVCWVDMSYRHVVAPLTCCGFTTWAAIDPSLFTIFYHLFFPESCMYFKVINDIATGIKGGRSMSASSNNQDNVLSWLQPPHTVDYCNIFYFKRVWPLFQFFPAPIQSFQDSVPESVQ